MKLVKKYVFLAGVSMALGGCEAVLDTEDQTALDGKTLFEDKALAELYLNKIYEYILPGFGMLENEELTNDAPGDRSVTTSGDGGYFMAGTLLEPGAVTNLDLTPGEYSYQTFGYVRNLIVFMDGVNGSPLTKAEKDELLGQAHFLRAYLYWDLVLHYGGVPIVDKILDINDGLEANSLARSTASACLDFIVSDLDLAIAMLQGKSMEFGRITAAAAAALKGRALLFYASPQFDPDGMSSADGVESRWQSAYLANKQAKEIADASGHALYPDYANIFLDEDNEEAIMIVKYSQAANNTHRYEDNVRPNSVANSSNIVGTPTWDFVKAFPMKDGTPVATSPDYDSVRYWKDRDPRFYAIVGYNGTAWSFSGRPGTRQWTYEDNEQENGVLPYTGFYLRKNVNTTLSRSASAQTPTDWIEIRYAEVLLNLAECANETGQTAEALDLLYQIRARAGIEAGSGNYGITATGKVQLRETIMNERRIELSFENKRHFDLRRRNLFVNGIDGASGDGINGTRRTGITTRLDTTYIYTVVDPSITEETDGMGNVTKTRGEVAFDFFEENVIDTVSWSDPEALDIYFNYEVFHVESVEINFLQPKYNFYYLPINATVRNDNLKQTINWLEGTFDPLAE